MLQDVITVSEWPIYQFWRVLAVSGQGDRRSISHDVSADVEHTASGSYGNREHGWIENQGHELIEISRDSQSWLRHLQLCWMTLARNNLLLYRPWSPIRFFTSSKHVSKASNRMSVMSDHMHVQLSTISAHLLPIKVISIIDNDISNKHLLPIGLWATLANSLAYFHPCLSLYSIWYCLMTIAIIGRYQGHCMFWCYYKRTQVFKLYFMIGMETNIVFDHSMLWNIQIWWSNNNCLNDNPLCPRSV